MLFRSRKHNPEINWQTGEVKLTRCPSECNVFIRAVKKDRKQKKLAEKGKYKVTMEEVDDEEMITQIRSGILDDANTIMEEIVEKHFIRKTDTEGMPELCKDSDDDEEDEDDDDEIMVFQIENGKEVHYIVSTTKPVSWETRDLNLQMKDGKSKTLEEIVPR